MTRLATLGLRGFRNLADASLAIPPEGLALVGENAQGKSNFLESIYYLEILRSYRGARDEQLVRFGADHFRIVGGIERSCPDGEARNADAPAEGDSRDGGAGSPTDGLLVAAAFERTGRRKKITVDGTEPPRLGDAIGALGVVLFTPDDIRMVSDAPQGRRRFMDIVLSLAVPDYLEALQRFRQVLSQRNAALRDGATSEAVAAWDPLFVRWAARVMVPRGEWVEAGAPRFESHYGAISGGAGGSIQYEPGLPGLAPSEWTHASLEPLLLEALIGARERDRRQGATSIGPHRDELRIRVETSEGQRDIRDFGSGGQRRTAALALRLVEAETVRAHRGREPLLLMDDVFAELDEGRSERVLDLLEDAAAGQVILTAPKASDLRFRADALPRWRIHSGTVEV